MYKKIVYLLTATMLLIGCSSHDFSDSQRSAISQNVKNIFGVEFNPNHDWKLTNNGVVEVNNIPNNATLVQVFACIKNNAEDSSTLFLLNKKEINGEKSVKINYDYPIYTKSLYVAITSSNGYFIKKIDGNAVNCASRALTRADDEEVGYTLPEVPMNIGIIEDSYASKRGWVPGEKLYQMTDYESQAMSVDDYSDEYKATFRDVIFSYFKNGRKYNNLPLVIKSRYYNATVYPITTGDEPIIISPVYKNDGGYEEVVNSDLYYYYFKESEVGDDPASFFESLPKYKAIQFDQCIADDDVILKHKSYALIYWGDGTPTVGTEGSYEFHKGYKIGFMVRAKTTVEELKKQGELYGDGRLNNHVNNYGNFKSSKLGVDGPRMAWMNVDGKMLLCCESGTDTDFNDIILEVEGGIEPLIPIPDIEENSYTMCFEDHQIGDYDMNDVVIKAKRINATQVEYSIVACGAYDELFIRNINGDVINGNTEVHEMFGADIEYVNTVNKNYEYVTEVVNVPETFSFLDENTQPYIFDKTTNKVVKLSKKGEDPHGIMIPNDFKYPLELICIKNAYDQFNSWGENMITDTDWYLYPNEGKIFVE